MLPAERDNRSENTTAFPEQTDKSVVRMVSVQLFAGAAQAVGSRQVSVPLKVDGCSVAELAAAVAAEYPQLQSLLTHSRWAIGNEFVNHEHRIAPEEQRPIAMIPPVSGG